MQFQMQVQVGFDGVQKCRAWTPVAVQLENTSDENIDGMLIIDKPEGIKDDMPLCTAPVSLPAHSNKLYHSYIRLFRYGGEITVTLARGNRVIEQRKVNINPASEDDKLVVSVGDRSSRLGFLQGETMKVPPKFDRYSNSSSSEATINAGSILPSILPDRPAAYDGVDVFSSIRYHARIDQSKSSQGAWYVGRHPAGLWLYLQAQTIAVIPMNSIAISCRSQ